MPGFRSCTAILPLRMPVLTGLSVYHSPPVEDSICFRSLGMGEGTEHHQPQPVLNDRARTGLPQASLCPIDMHVLLKEPTLPWRSHLLKQFHTFLWLQALLQIKSLAFVSQSLGLLSFQQRCKMLIIQALGHPSYCCDLSSLRLCGDCRVLGDECWCSVGRHCGVGVWLGDVPKRRGAAFQCLSPAVLELTPSNAS